MFGALAAEAMKRQGVGSRNQGSGGATARAKAKASAGEDVEGWVAELRGLMWRDAGLLRDGVGLRRAWAELEGMRESMPLRLTRRSIETRNLHVVAEAIVRAALGRAESRGAHFRRDFPGKADEGRHSVVRCGGQEFI